MSIRTLAACALSAAALLGACAPIEGPMPMPYTGPESTAFNAADFAWSTRAGQGSIQGEIRFRQDGRAYSCTGSAGLTPETPFTRARFRQLYGSTEGAAIPEAVVRARTVADTSADYRAYVRSQSCTNGTFSFEGLPDGGWFIIVPVSTPGADRIILMRHVETRGGRAVAVIM